MWHITQDQKLKISIRKEARWISVGIWAASIPVSSTSDIVLKWNYWLHCHAYTVYGVMLWKSVLSHAGIIYGVSYYYIIYCLNRRAEGHLCWFDLHHHHCGSDSELLGTVCESQHFSSWVWMKAGHSWGRESVCDLSVWNMTTCCFHTDHSASLRARDGYYVAFDHSVASNRVWISLDWIRLKYKDSGIYLS